MTDLLDGRPFRILCGDAVTVLRTLPASSVHCVVTSPPYWGLRDYGAEGQIGLEPTPEEYVAKLVGVFREVRRVMRDDGTLWLNLGDSYNAAGRDGHGTRQGFKQGTNRASANGSDTNRPTAPDLKPKDLCMIPARVALALQQPYYTGNIASESDRRWLAAMIDGEGCIYISRSKAGATTGRDRQYVRTRDAFDAGLRVTSTDVRLLEEIARIVGHGTVRACSNRTGKPAFDWSVYSGNARSVLREVYPHLIAKQHEARLLLGCPPSGEDATAAWSALKSIHKGSSSDVDFSAPPSMFEPGYYLRSDIIWSKLNPMPESVTDRPTKAHEYLFLLSKSERYYYDAEAIKEAAVTDDRPRSSWEERREAEPIRRGDPGVSGHVTTTGTLASQPGRNRRTVWTVATHPFAEAHFATFPPALVEPCIKAGTSERGVCPECGASWERVVERRDAADTGAAIGGDPTRRDGGTRERDTTGRGGNRLAVRTVGTNAWRQSCKCAVGGGNPLPAIVLDPFSGAGTTALVATRLRRRALGIELNREYVAMSERRIRGDAPLFLGVA